MQYRKLQPYSKRLISGLIAGLLFLANPSSYASIPPVTRTLPLRNSPSDIGGYGHGVFCATRGLYLPTRQAIECRVLAS